MGPIERELRARAERGPKSKPGLSHEAYMVQMDAMFSLFDQWFPGRGSAPLHASVSTAQHWPDIMSEAIEAAEALGL